MYTLQKEEPVRLILLMQRENILYMTDTIDVASFLADFTCYINLRRWNTRNVVVVNHVFQLNGLQQKHFMVHCCD
jgi:hypothetical protein